MSSSAERPPAPAGCGCAGSRERIEPACPAFRDRAATIGRFAGELVDGASALLAVPMIASAGSPFSTMRLKMVRHGQHNHRRSSPGYSRPALGRRRRGQARGETRRGAGLTRSRRAASLIWRVSWSNGFITLFVPPAWIASRINGATSFFGCAEHHLGRCRRRRPLAQVPREIRSRSFTAYSNPAAPHRADSIAGVERGLTVLRPPRP